MHLTRACTNTGMRKQQYAPTMFTYSKHYHQHGKQRMYKTVSTVHICTKNTCLMVKQHKHATHACHVKLRSKTQSTVKHMQAHTKQSAHVAESRDACTYIHTPKHVITTSMKNTACKQNCAIESMQMKCMSHYHTHIGALHMHVSR